MLDESQRNKRNFSLLAAAVNDVERNHSFNHREAVFTRDSVVPVISVVYFYTQNIYCFFFYVMDYSCAV